VWNDQSKRGQATLNNPEEDPDPFHFVGHDDDLRTTVDRIRGRNEGLSHRRRSCERVAGEEEESEVIVKVLLARQYNLWGNGLWIRMIVVGTENLIRVDVVMESPKLAE
jgi:hypothetical protein